MATKIKQKTTDQKADNVDACEIEITRYLGNGILHAKTARTISHQMGIKMREVSSRIEKARQRGIPICASCAWPEAGYYMAGTDDELKGYIRQLTSRHNTISKTITALKETAKKGIASWKTKRNS